MQNSITFFTEQKISGPQQLAEDSVWLRLFLAALAKAGSRSVSVRHLQLALVHRYRPETGQQLTTFVNQLDGEAAKAAAKAYKIATNPDTHPADPAGPPSEQVEAAASPIDLTTQGIEPNPGPSWLDKALDASVAAFAALPAAGPVPGKGMAPMEAYRRLQDHRKKLADAERAYERYAKQNSQVRRVPVRGITTAATMAVEKNPGPPKGRSRSKPKAKGRKKQQPKAKQAKAPSQAPVSARPRGQRGDMLMRNVPDILDRTDLALSTTVDGTTAIAPGTLICKIPINPTGNGDVTVTRPTGINAALLNYIAALWELWDCDVTMIIKPTGNRFVTGTFTAGFDMDAKDNVPTLEQLIQQGGQTFTYASGGRVSYSPGNRAKATARYWTQPSGSDPRLYTKGVFYVLSNETPTTYGSTGAVAGVLVPFQVHCHYRFRFKNPTFEPVSQGTGVAMYAPATTPIVDTYDPFGLDSIHNTSANYFYAPGIVVGELTSGGLSYGVVAFPSGTQFDSWIGVGAMFHTEDAKVSGTPTLFKPYGGTSTVDVAVVQATARADVALRINFADTASVLAFDDAHQQQQDGTWTTLTGAALSIPVWLCFGFSAAGSTVTGVGTCCLTAIGAANPTISERQWRSCGPATTHGKVIAADPDNLHIAAAVRDHERKAAAARDNADSLRQQLRLLRAELIPETPETKFTPDGKVLPPPRASLFNPRPLTTRLTEEEDEVEIVEEPIPPPSVRTKTRSLK